MGMNEQQAMEEALVAVHQEEQELGVVFTPEKRHSLVMAYFNMCLEEDQTISITGVNRG